MSTYFDITTKSKYLYVSDIAIQCMYIQSNACILLNACIQAHSQEFAKGGWAFLEAGNNSERTWPKFSLVLNQIEAVFLTKSGDLRKKVFTKLKRFFRPESGDLKKKKRSLLKFSQFSWTTLGEVQKKETPFFWSKEQQVLHNFWSPIPLWGLFSFLEQKSVSKALKTWHFAYFLGQWGGSNPSRPPPPGYATACIFCADTV